MSYQVAKLIARISENLPKMDENVMQGWIENPKALKKALKESLCPPSNGSQVANIDLAAAYNLCGMYEEYSNDLRNRSREELAEDPNVWKLLVLQGLTCKKLVDAYKKAGVKTYLYINDMDGDVKDNQRDPGKNGSYLVGFNRNVEADEDNKNQSADQRRKQACQDITLLERLLLGLAYFLATKEHLDEKNVTQCQDSRDSDGRVPCVRWSSGGRGVCVRWYDSGDRDGSLRARSVVSLPPKA